MLHPDKESPARRGNQVTGTATGERPRGADVLALCLRPAPWLELPGRGAAPNDEPTDPTESYPFSPSPVSSSYKDVGVYAADACGRLDWCKRSRSRSGVSGSQTGTQRRVGMLPCGTRSRERPFQHFSTAGWALGYRPTAWPPLTGLHATAVEFLGE